MYNNDEYLAEQQIKADYTKNREKMRNIKKISGAAFFINLPVLTVFLVLFIIGLISFDINNFMLSSFVGIIIICTLTFFATYKKNKIASALVIFSYIIYAPDSTIVAIMAVPAIFVYILHLKSLFDEDKLKSLDGYPHFDEKINTYSELHNIENPDEKITYLKNTPYKMEDISDISTHNSDLNRNDNKTSCEMEEISLDDLTGVMNNELTEYKQQQ